VRDPDVSEQYTVSIFRVEEKAKPETSRSRRQVERTMPTSYSFLLGLLSDLESEGNMFLRNVGFCSNYTAFQPRNPYSS
jgi:hypothetical protein